MKDPISKITKPKRTGDVAQVVKHLPSNHQYWEKKEQENKVAKN
jgi:hypothetical protein